MNTTRWGPAVKKKPRQNVYHMLGFRCQKIANINTTCRGPAVKKTAKINTTCWGPNVQKTPLKIIPRVGVPLSKKTRQN